jgi:hypothetical protein
VQPLRVVSNPTPNISIAPQVQQQYPALRVVGPAYQAPAAQGFNPLGWLNTNFVQPVAQSVQNLGHIGTAGALMVPDLYAHLTGNQAMDQGLTNSIRSQMGQVSWAPALQQGHFTPQVAGNIINDSFNAASLLPFGLGARAGLGAGEKFLPGLAKSVGVNAALSVPATTGQLMANGQNLTPAQIAQAYAQNAATFGVMGAGLHVAGAGVGQSIKIAAKGAGKLGQKGFANLNDPLINSNHITPEAKASLARLDATQAETDKLLQQQGVKLARPPATTSDGVPVYPDTGMPMAATTDPRFASGQFKPGVKIKGAASVTLPGNKERGLVTSVHEAVTVGPKTQAKVQGAYETKTNDQLMGEAKALLTEGAKIDFGKTKNLDQKVAATIQQAINLDAAGKHDAAAALFNNLSEHATELGKGVQAFSMLDRMSPASIALSVAGKIKRYNEAHPTRPIPELTGEQQKQIVKLITAMDKAKGEAHADAANKLQTTINDFIPSSFADKAITVWKAGLLTSLRTHERNLVGNAGMQVGEVLKDLPATLVDKIMATRTGQRTTTMTLRGLQELGSKATRHQIKTLVLHGYDPYGDIGKYDLHHITWANTPMQQALKWYTEAVFRPLGAEDKAFFNSAFARSMYDQAGAAAINAGRKGNRNFINKLVAKPTEAMLENATKDANYATFHDSSILGKIATRIKREAQDHGGATGQIVTNMLMPFTNVPGSIAAKTFAYSPLGLIRGAVDMGRVMNGGKVIAQQIPGLQRQAAQEVGRGVVGSGLAGLGWYLMSQGLMTGVPKSQAESNQWQLEGKQQNSVLIGGKWRSINSIGPQELIVLAGAKAQEQFGKAGGDWKQFLASAGKDQLSQTFLSGVQGPINALSDPYRYGQSYVNSTASGVIPNIVKDIAKAGDSTQRETNTIKDSLQNSIPGLRNSLLPKRDVLGNPISQEPTGAGAFFDLFNSKTPITDPLTNELHRLFYADANHTNSATPSKLAKGETLNGTKTQLNPQQLDQLEQTAGGAERAQMNQLIASDAYKAASDKDKANALQAITKDARVQAKSDFASGTTSDTSKLDPKAQAGLDKANFTSSGKNYQVVGDTVYRRDAQGNVTATPKVKFDYQMGQAQLTSYKNANNVNGWLQTAQTQLGRIQQQLQDPSVDPLDALTLQNEASTLSSQIQKYQQQGNSFTKPKSTGTRVSKGKAIKLPSFKSSSIAKAPSFKVSKVKTPSIKMASNTKAPTIKISKKHLVA